MGLSMISVSNRMTNIAEHLGYSRNSKLLIIHADDLGMCHSINEATFKALQASAITSASVMVPCPCFSEVVEYCRTDPEMDLGIHLTITSEWQSYRWGPVSPVETVQSLVDDTGNFWSTTTEAVLHADPVEVETEIVAQVEMAIEKGIKPTHLDSHMFALLQSVPLGEVFASVAKRFGLPLRIGRGIAKYAGTGSALHHANVLLEQYFQATEQMTASEWPRHYEKMIESIKPGLNEL